MGDPQFCPICNKPYEYIEYNSKKNPCGLFSLGEKRKDITIKMPKCQHYTTAQAARAFHRNINNIRENCRLGLYTYALKIDGRWYIRYDLYLKWVKEFYEWFDRFSPYLKRKEHFVSSHKTEGHMGNDYLVINPQMRAPEVWDEEAAKAHDFAGRLDHILTYLIRR